MGLVENVLEVCERFVPLLFLVCFDCVAGKTGIGERCWSRWEVIECELGVAVWLVRCVLLSFLIGVCVFIFGSCVLLCLFSPPFGLVWAFV